MIELRNASKSFGRVNAVKDASFRMKEENVFGLIGTNGAGKSTILRMAAGVLKPDEGLFLVDGMNAFDIVDAKDVSSSRTSHTFFPTPHPGIWSATTAACTGGSTGNFSTCISLPSVWTAEEGSRAFPRE